MAEKLVILTGGIGSGKSLVAGMFRKLGVCVIDADDISHELTQRGGQAIDAIRSALGEASIAADGSMNRAAVRAMAFSDAGIRARLEAILHPMIQSLADKRLLEAPGRYAIYVVPLWWEKRAQASPERDMVTVINVDCDEETQVRRVMSRSGLTRDEVHAIMAAQVSRQQRCDLSDHTILNDGPVEQTEAQVLRLHQRLIDS
jgi:dephospho-CoA kinase